MNEQELAKLLKDNPDLRQANTHGLKGLAMVAAGAITKDEFRTRFLPVDGNDVKVTLPWPPSTNRYWRNMNGRMVTSTQARQYKQRVRAILGDARVDENRTDMLSVQLNMYRPTKSGDLDNYIKVILDAMQGQLYKNDNQIVELHAYRHDDKKNPRIEVSIRTHKEVQ